MAALLEVLPLQIPALRPSSPEAQGDRGPRAAPLPGRGGSGGWRRAGHGPLRQAVRPAPARVLHAVR